MAALLSSVGHLLGVPARALARAMDDFDDGWDDDLLRLDDDAASRLREFSLSARS